ncbi:MAG: DivIVA domain-containing protein [Christensenellales bacterium]
MPITVTMIEEKEFKTKVRGYDPVEVDEFLDAICDEMVEQQNTIQALREQLKQRIDQPSPSYAPLPVSPIAPPLAPISQLGQPEEPSIPVDIETAQKLLQRTQQSCDEVLEEARLRAAKIVEDAQKEAATLVPDPELEDLESQRETLRKEIGGLKSQAANFRKRFQSMLKDQSEIIDSETDLF